MADIDRLCSKYIVWSIVYIVILTVGCFIIEKLGLFAGLMYPVAVSAGFAIVVESADALVWRKVARKSPDSLTTFYTAVSGFRMLLALATMLVCYIIVGRDALHTGSAGFLLCDAGSSLNLLFPPHQWRQTQQ